MMYTVVLLHRSRDKMVRRGFHAVVWSCGDVMSLKGKSVHDFAQDRQLSRA